MPPCIVGGDSVGRIAPADQVFEDLFLAVDSIASFGDPVDRASSYVLH